MQSTGGVINKIEIKIWFTDKLGQKGTCLTTTFTALSLELARSTHIALWKIYFQVKSE